jgi:hypothetical protein
MRYALLLLVVLTACSSKASVSEVSGEIFIVTKGRATVKMSGTPVYFLPLREVESHIQLKTLENPAHKQDVYFYLQ